MYICSSIYGACACLTQADNTSNNILIIIFKGKMYFIIKGFSVNY